MTILAAVAEAARSPRWFWLDGGGSMPWSRQRSIIGSLAPDDLSLVLADGVVISQPGGEVVGSDIFEVLDQHLDGDPDTHWVGYFGYAARPDLPAQPMPGVPDAVWMRARSVAVVDHPTPTAVPGSSPAGAEAVPDWYQAAFDRIQAELRAGNSYEVNLTYRIRQESDVDPVEAYHRMRATNPAPYAGMLRHGDTWLLSASPERFATIDRRRWIETRPIKGTTPRSPDPAVDADLREQLATEAKFRSENLMITDLLRNDLSMVCEVGTVTVPQLMEVESYASVHQLVSTVRGRLRAEVSTLAALRSIFPAGSMTGAPKLRTMSIIDEVEDSPRGPYAGAFGWISGDGRADLGVVIRSVFRNGPGPWQLGTGGGITVASDAPAEWAESRWKAERLRAALRP